MDVDSITATPRSIDWSEIATGEDDAAGHTPYEAFECGTCHFVTVSNYPGPEIDCGSDDAAAVYRPDGTQWDEEDQEEEDPHPCGAESIGYPEGPMMNYAYPLTGDVSGEDAARLLVHLPVIPVQLADGSWWLALTGGGMDLSWEICAAYVALDRYPPVHFVSNLPSIGTMGNERATWWLPTANAAAESLAIAERWATSNRERFTERFGS